MSTAVAGRALAAVLCLSGPAPLGAQTCTTPDQVVPVGDSGLRDAIVEALGVTNSAGITCGALETLRNLPARGREIASLAGLEYAFQIEDLDLGDNRIRDLSALKDLGNLKLLQLDRNLIEDLTPLLRNGHIKKGVSLDVSRNCLDLAADSSDSTALKTLETRGVALEYQPQKDPPACRAS